MVSVVMVFSVVSSVNSWLCSVESYCFIMLWFVMIFLVWCSSLGCVWCVVGWC